MSYYVYIWAEGEKKWVPIKEFKGSPFAYRLHYDPSEQLSYKQAQDRYRQLATTYPAFNFKVDLFP